MPPTLTYPGVYIVEVPSGVHSITGVATSIAAFFGQATSGPINQPIPVQSVADYQRTFGTPIPGGYLGQMVQQFFANGGATSFVVRLAPGSVNAAAALNDLAGNPVLTISANSPGLWGNAIVILVDYATPAPDSTFNLTVIYSPPGGSVKTESFASLSMDPLSSRYAPSFIAQSSQLITATSPAPAAPATQGYSQSRYPFAGLANQDAIIGALTALYNPAWGAVGNLNISVDGGPVVTANLAAAGFGANIGALTTYLTNQINNALGATSGRTVAVTVDTSPTNAYFLRLTSATGAKKSVQVTRAPSNDLASILLFGVDQGGIEVSQFSELRPAPNGISFTGDSEAVMTALAGATVDNVTQITLDSQNYPLALGVAGTPFYQGSTATDLDGIRENLMKIANVVNTQATGWSASVAGYRLSINEVRPNSPQDIDASFAIATAGNAATFGTGFKSAQAQTPLINGADGSAPGPLDYQGSELNRTGFYALDNVSLFNLLVIPGDGLNNEADWTVVRSAAAVYCQNHRAFLLLDAPVGFTQAGLLSPTVPAQVQTFRAGIGAPDISCAVFYPRVQVNDQGTLRYMGVSGMMAGICASTDSARGVWNAPAGLNAILTGVTGLEVTLTDKQNGILNPLGVNCLRSFAAGIVNWGGRTVAGFDNSGDDDWKYIQVRRFALFLEESLYEGTQWVVFQPNADPLWAQIRMNITAFLMNLFQQNAFAGTTPQDAFFVKCDAETTTPYDQEQGIVNIIVGFAPIRPAEFVVISIQQIMPTS